MRFLDWIIEELEGIADWFHEAYYIVRDWVWPFYLLEDPLYAIYGRFRWLAEWFGDFKEWVEDTADRLLDILSKWDIWDFFEWWFDAAEKAWNWVRNAFNNVLDIIADWWSTILPYIISYIDIVGDALYDLEATWDTFWTVTWPEWVGNLQELRSLWDTFWTETFPTLVSFSWLATWWNDRLLDINSLLESQVLTLAPFWAGWQEVRDSVVEFFADPLQWAYDKLDEFFERFW